MKKVLLAIVLLFTLNTFSQPISFSPTKGCVGNIITIKGTNLNNVSSIRFANTKEIIYSQIVPQRYDTLLQLVVPAITSNCNILLYHDVLNTIDTLKNFIVEMSVKIEDPNYPASSIPDYQKFQSSMSSPVYFVNNSTNNTGKKLYIKWDFKDNWAPACTSFSVPLTGIAPYTSAQDLQNRTSGRFVANGNVYNGRLNACGYSNDSLPVHTFVNWDTLYTWHYYGHDFPPFDSSKWSKSYTTWPPAGNPPAGKKWVHPIDTAKWNMAIFAGTTRIDTIQMWPMDLLPNTPITLNQNIPDPIAINKGMPFMRSNGKLDYYTLPSGTIVDTSSLLTIITPFDSLPNGQKRIYTGGMKIPNSKLNLYKYVFNRIVAEPYNVELFINDSTTSSCIKKSNIFIGSNKADAWGLGKNKDGKELPGYDLGPHTGVGFELLNDNAAKTSPVNNRKFLMFNYDSLFDRHDYTPCVLDGFIPFGGASAGGYNYPPYNNSGQFNPNTVWQTINDGGAAGTNWTHYQSPFNTGFSHMGALAAQRDGFITVGLIIGNGCNGTNCNQPDPNSVSDTIWYHNFIQILKLDASFEVLPHTKADTTVYFCSNLLRGRGDTVVVVPTSPIQKFILTDHWIWGDGLETIDSFFVSGDQTSPVPIARKRYTIDNQDPAFPKVHLDSVFNVGKYVRIDLRIDTIWQCRDGQHRLPPQKIDTLKMIFDSAFFVGPLKHKYNLTSFEMKDPNSLAADGRRWEGTPIQRILTGQNGSMSVYQKTVVIGIIDTFYVTDTLICVGKEVQFVNYVRYWVPYGCNYRPNMAIDTFPFSTAPWLPSIRSYDDWRYASYGYPIDTFKTFGTPPTFWTDPVTGLQRTYFKERIYWDWESDGIIDANMVQVPKHAFNLPGIYKVSMITRDSAGFWDTCVVKIKVKDLAHCVVPIVNNTIGNNRVICGSSTIIGSPPIGGNGIFTYLWLSSTDSATGYLNAPNINTSLNYSTQNNTSIKWYKRIVNSGILSDTSNVIKITTLVKPVANIYTLDTIKCFNGTATSFSLIDTSSGSYNYRFWSYGNNINDTAKAINANFINFGTYNIILKIQSSNSCVDSALKTIIVYPNTKVGFKVNKASQCIYNNSFIYTDTSTITSGTFTRLWNFGDASTATTSPFTKSYSNANTYQVKLVTTSNLGCKDSITKTVVVNPKPLLGFTTNTANQCLKTNNYFFSDTSKISSGFLSRIWTLGNGDTTSLINPSKIFGSAGTYNIKLLATSDNGCKDSLTKPVIVYPNTNIGFKMNNVTQCINGNSFLYTDTSNISTGTFTRLWNFGDASTATTNPFTKSYSIANAYQVKLVTTSNLGCKDSITKTVIVNPKPTVGFTTNTANQCVNTNSYLFADTSKISSGTINRLWTLGNGDTSSIINPSKVFSNAGTYNIKLLATSDNGCKDSLTKAVIVYPNTNMGFKVNNASQCLNGNSFLYTDTSSISTGTFTRLWNFGDFTNSTANPFTKTYYNANTYQVKLVSTTNNGCKDSITKTVTVNPKPDVYFMNLNPSQCLKGNLFSFPDSSFIGSGSMSRTWYLGEGSTDTNLVANKSYSQANTYHVKLVVSSNNACKDSMTSDVIVNPQPIFVATAQGRTIICPSEMVNIKATTASGNTYQWLKNEVPLPSSTDSVLLTSAQGIYKVITSTAFACADTSQGISIVVNPLPKAYIGINNAAQCLAGNQFQFTDSSTLASGSLHRLWYLNNVLSDTAFNINKSYNAAGNYSVKLVALSETNCKDSITKTITVYPQPTPDFTINNPSQCLVPNSFVFTDVSNITSGSTTRTWYTGNGNNATTVVATQVYSTVGNHTVKLVSKSDKACSDSISKTITVNANPVAGVMLGQTTNVAPTTPYIYTVAQQLNHTYLWSVTNGIVVAGQGTNAVTIQWIGIGSGKIQAIITNPQGCNDTSSLTLSVTNVGISEIQNIHNLQVYPNPNSGAFTIRINLSKTAHTQISLLNMLGQQVWAEIKQLNAGEQEVELSTNLAAGLYVLRLNNEDGQVQKSVVVR